MTPQNINKVFFITKSVQIGNNSIYNSMIDLWALLSGEQEEDTYFSNSFIY